MIALWLTTTALAGAPAGVDLDDPTLWEARARRAVSGPSSTCYRLTGEVSITVRLYQPATAFSRATRISTTRGGPFEGVLDRGTWTRFVVDLKQGGEPAESDLLIGPFLGHVPAGVPRSKADGPPSPQDTDDPSVRVGISGEGVDVQSAGVAARSTLSDVISGAWSDAPSTLFAQWDEERRAVELVVSTPLEDQPDVVTTTRVRFPGGQAVPIAITSTFPKRARVPAGPFTATLMSAQAHVRGQVVNGELLPTLESISGALGVLGFTVAYEQRITYLSAQRCH